MISCYLQKLVGQIRLKPNEEWLRLKDVIECGGDAGLEVWLKEVASLASDLESNFEFASKGRKPSIASKKFKPLKNTIEDRLLLIKRQSMLV